MTNPDLKQEFDTSVNQYNQYLSSLDNPEARKKNNRSAFFRGMTSVLGIFDPTKPQFSHPLYSREDLTPIQKDTIALASDWQRVDMTLDRVLSRNSSNDNFSIEEATQGKQIVQQMYGHLRDTYIKSKTK